MPFSSTFIPGLHCKDDRLIEFGLNDIKVIRPWGPRAGAWRFSKGSWECYRPYQPLFETRPIPYTGFSTKLHMPLSARGLKLSDCGTSGLSNLQYLDKPPNDCSSRYRSYMRYLEYHNIRQGFFQKNIPKSILKRIDMVLERNWHLLQLFNRARETVSLFDLTPALAYMLASAWRFRPISNHMRASRSLVTRPHRYICGWLGFPNQKASVNLLRKIPPFSLCLDQLLMLRTHMHGSPYLKALLHAPEINYGI